MRESSIFERIISSCKASFCCNMRTWTRINQSRLPKDKLTIVLVMLLLTSMAVMLLHFTSHHTNLKLAMKRLSDVQPINRRKSPTGQRKGKFENKFPTDFSSDVKDSKKISSTIKQRRKFTPAWKKYLKDFKVTQLYNPYDIYLTKLLDGLLFVEIRQISIFRHGTQLKFRIEFVDGNSAIAKPMRTKKKAYVTYPKWDSFLTDIERHTAEIAAFHLDRLLDFRRVPPCTGRALNFTRDIISKTMDPDILDTQRTKDGAKCIMGGCRRDFCNETALTCAREGLLEVSVCQIIPEAFHGKEVKYPWRPIHHYGWENKNICERVKKDRYVRKYGLFLDFMDIAIFDYLMLNYDRRSFVILRNKQNRTKTGFALFDNGKGFGDPFNDDLTFLTPIKQCCQFRNSTYQTAVQLTKITTRLSDKMRASLWQVPLLVLTEDFYVALDRRLKQVVKEMDICIEKFGTEKVFSEEW